MGNSKKVRSGFTIIEVVLVLAIAGLIFLMVFVALPALQRSQRDTQRRQDYAGLSANITSYMTNNGGRLPNTGAKLDASEYINATGQDPNGKAYTITVIDAEDEGGAFATSRPEEGEVYVYSHADCNGLDEEGEGYAAPGLNDSSKAFAIYGYLETGTYCQSSI